jgi:hypothetical protein
MKGRLPLPLTTIPTKQLRRSALLKRLFAEFIGTFWLVLGG